MTRDEYNQIMRRATMIWRNPKASESEVRGALCEDVLNQPSTINSLPPGSPAKASEGMKVAKSTDEAKLNKWESQWLAVLRTRSFVWIGVQNVTLKLADDCRYTPDAFTVDLNGHLTAWEVKGWMRDDALVKIKVAARMFPWVEFVLVTRDGKSWKENVVKP